MKKLLFILVAVIIGIGGGEAISDTANITYVAPDEREDNTELLPSEIAGFKVYDSTGAMVKQLPSDARGFDMPTTSVTQSLFITTIDTEGREAAYSVEAIIPASISHPKLITNIQVTVSP